MKRTLIITLVLTVLMLGMVGSMVTATAAQTAHPTKLTLTASYTSHNTRPGQHNPGDITFQGNLYSLEPKPSGALGWMVPITVKAPVIIQQEENGQWKTFTTCHLAKMFPDSKSDSSFYHTIVPAPQKPGVYRYRAVFEGIGNWAPSTSDVKDVRVS